MTRKGCGQSLSDTLQKLPQAAGVLGPHRLEKHPPNTDQRPSRHRSSHSSTIPHEIPTRSPAEAPPVPRPRFHQSTPHTGVIGISKLSDSFSFSPNHSHVSKCFTDQVFC